MDSRTRSRKRKVRVSSKRVLEGEIKLDTCCIDTASRSVALVGFLHRKAITLNLFRLLFEPLQGISLATCDSEDNTFGIQTMLSTQMGNNMTLVRYKVQVVLSKYIRHLDRTRVFGLVWNAAICIIASSNAVYLGTAALYARSIPTAAPPHPHAQ
eukprot:5086726-Pleurochrysis_carterae.AAC.1